MALLNGFNRIARLYDLLASAVFGKSIKESQLYFLDRVPGNSKILILGGGTGWLLKRIMQLKLDSEIWYIEASDKMISLSKKQIGNQHNVHFIHGTENDIPEVSFDVVITNFYLDIFDQQSLPYVIGKIRKSISIKALWLVTDFFDDGKSWKKIMLTIMYRFFAIVSDVKSKNLPDWNKALQEVGMAKQTSKFFFSGFIESCVYKND